MILRRVPIPLTLLRQRPFVSTFKPVPWFVSPDEPDFPLDNRRNVPSFQSLDQRPSHARPLPQDTPDHLRTLYYELTALPYLDTSYLVVTRPIAPIPGPELPLIRPKGTRRRRGGTTAGTGIDIPWNGLWNWIVLAQVKEGSESRGSITRVVKIVRKVLGQLAATNSTVTMPPKGRQSFTDGWAMLDVGDFAVHILNRDAREKWFPMISSNC